MRAHLERDFSSYLKKEHVKDAATGRQSFWKTYDLLVGVVGAAAARGIRQKAAPVPGRQARTGSRPEESRRV